MKKIIISGAIALFAGSLIGCESGPSYDDLVAQANQEIAVAKKMHYEWRDTGKIMKQAKKAKEDGDSAKAKKLVQKAIDQAKLAQQQAKAEANPHPTYF
ncbi:MAG: hypothetical protein LJE56_07795 [Acidiferrobacterales bacterium]|jgi:hypothetical protein|nr:hypothetical protein [Acidiferrobacterales bacterium]